jgi:hypothetical protein
MKCEFVAMKIFSNEILIVVNKINFDDKVF